MREQVEADGNRVMYWERCSAYPRGSAFDDLDEITVSQIWWGRQLIQERDAAAVQEKKPVPLEWHRL